MKAWRVVLCAGVVALVGCSGPQHVPPHTVTMPRDGRHSAALTVVSGAATVIVGTANLGDNLIRVSTPASSAVRPVLAGRGLVLLYLGPAGHGGPAAVHILLNPHVIWRLMFAGGASLTTVSLGQGRVSSVDFAAGSSVIQMTLPCPTARPRSCWPAGRARPC